jgi:hypothetical protein
MLDAGGSHGLRPSPQIAIDKASVTSSSSSTVMMRMVERLTLP